jgi:curli biogenesis system outer membrane secretion channel CsgG
MKLAISAIAVTAALGLGGGLAACGSTAAPASHAGPSRPAPTVTVTRPGSQPGQQAPAAPPAQAPSGHPNGSDPWSVVSAYYGDIESGNYAQAWSLLGSGATTGQTYQQFVNGFACTGGQSLTEVGESGDQVTFDLAATNSCNGQVQHFTGTDTVVNGTIVGADVHQTGG